MRRFNIFQTSHSALRSLLLDTSLRIQFTDFSQAQQAAGTFDQVMELVLACQRQAEEESRYILPAISLYDQHLENVFADYAADSFSPAMQLLARIDLVEKHPAKDRVASLAPTLTGHAFRKFAEQVIRGLQAQEDRLNPVLWKYYSDGMLRELLLRIEGRQTISEWLSMSEWMMKDMSDEEISGWLVSIRPTLPPAVYELLVGRVSSKLPLLRWQNIETGLENRLRVA